MNPFQKLIEANRGAPGFIQPNRFLIVGGNPFGHSYTSLRVVGAANTKEQADTLWHAAYEECGGLLILIDTQQPFADVQVDPNG